MKVLIQTRPGLGGILTGDVTQVRKTAEALEALGVTVRYSDSLEPDPGDADVVHLFSTLQPYYTYLRLRHLKSARRTGGGVDDLLGLGAGRAADRKCVAPRLDALSGLAYGRRAAAEPAGPACATACRQTDLPFDIQARFYDLEHRMSTDDHAALHLRQQRTSCCRTRISNTTICSKHFGTRNDYVAVPNAVDPVFATGDADAFARKFGLRDFVLCCAAVQARKNQIRLIKAADALGLPLVLIGPEEARYAARCRAAASDRVHFLGQLEGADLRNAYAAARTHALVSFYETPGLASLEAAISDNTIVASDRGSPQGIFRRPGILLRSRQCAFDRGGTVTGLGSNARPGAEGAHPARLQLAQDRRGDTRGLSPGDRESRKGRLRRDQCRRAAMPDGALCLGFAARRE